MSNQIETSITGSTEASKNNTRYSRKRTHLGEHISCNSLSLRTVESEIPIKKLERHNTCSKESVEASVSNKITSSKHSGVVSALKVSTLVYVRSLYNSPYLPVIPVNNCHRISATTAKQSLGSGLNYSLPQMDGRDFLIIDQIYAGASVIFSFFFFVFFISFYPGTVEKFNSKSNSHKVCM